MKKRVLILSGPSVYVYTNEYEASAAQYFTEKGYKVYLASCFNNFKACGANPYGRLTVCWQCQIHRKTMLAENKNITGIEYPKTRNRHLEKISSFLKEQNIKADEDLKNLYYQNFDVGLSILTWCFSKNDSDVGNFKKFFSQAKLRYLIREALFAYHFALDCIEKCQPEIIVFFNGRVIEQRAFFRAAEKSKKIFYSIEGGFNRCDENLSWVLLKNGGIHDRKRLSEEIENLWNNSKEADKEKIGQEWFHERRKKTSSMNLFTHGMNENNLGEFQPGCKPIVSIFTSTWAERAALNEQWNSPHGNSQFEILLKLKRVLMEITDKFQFIIRLHPNQITVPGEVQKIMSLKCADFQILPPESVCDSYALIEKSNVVITLGSTIGLEATFWGKPSILLAPSQYSDFLVSAYPQDLSEIPKLISCPIVYPKSDAIKVGYFNARGDHGLAKTSKYHDLVTIRRYVNPFLKIIEKFRKRKGK